MSRVSSFGNNQVLVNQLLQHQTRLFETQNQINTGKKTTEFRGLAREAQTLLSAKSLLTRNDGYLANLKDAQQKLNTNELFLENIRSAGDQLRDAITDALAQNKALAFDEALEQAVSIILGSLNTQVDGRYLFAGSRTDTKPVTIDDINGLLAAPNVSDIFTNDNVRLTARVSDSVELTYGVLASEVGTDILTVLKTLVDFNASAMGPIEGQLTATQTNFLTTELGNLVSAIDKVQAVIAENGLRQNRAEGLKENIAIMSDYLTVFVGDIEDVNMAEAVTRLNADQLALQVSYQMVAQLSKLSLVNFL